MRPKSEERKLLAFADRLLSHLDNDPYFSDQGKVADRIWQAAIDSGIRLASDRKPVDEVSQIVEDLRDEEQLTKWLESMKSWKFGPYTREHILFAGYMTIEDPDNPKAMDYGVRLKNPNGVTTGSPHCTPDQEPDLDRLDIAAIMIRCKEPDFDPEFKKGPNTVTLGNKLHEYYPAEFAEDFDDDGVYYLRDELYRQLLPPFFTDGGTEACFGSSKGVHTLRYLKELGFDVKAFDINLDEIPLPGEEKKPSKKRTGKK